MPTAGRTPPGQARERILDVAAGLFYREGVNTVGVDTIVARSGVAKATLYSHFGSKEELVLAVLARLDAAWCESVRQTVERRTDARDRLLAVFDVLAEEFARDDYRGSAFVNAAAEFADAAHPVRRACAAHKRRVTAIVRTLAVEAGVAEPDEVAADLMLLLAGAVTTRTVQDDADAAQRARRLAGAVLERPLTDRSV